MVRRWKGPMTADRRWWWGPWGGRGSAADDGGMQIKRNKKILQPHLLKNIF